MQDHQAEFMKHHAAAKGHADHVHRVSVVTQGIADMMQRDITDASHVLRAGGVSEELIEKAMMHFVQGRQVALQLAPAFGTLLE